MKYIDTHAHLMGSFFKENPEEALSFANSQGVDKIILPGTTINDSFANIEFAKKHKVVYAMIGIHPSESGKHNCDYLKNINPKHIVGIGEIGLDFYHKDNPKYSIQANCFVKHLDFAIKHQKPVVIHMRNSEQETYDILKKYKEKKLSFVLHSFTASLEWAKKFIELGAYISFSGILTFKNAPELKKIAQSIPINRILTETDSPFLAPVPKRGKSNTPGYVKYVTKYLAELIKDFDSEEQVYKNACKFFGL